MGLTDLLLMLRDYRQHFPVGCLVRPRINRIWLISPSMSFGGFWYVFRARTVLTVQARLCERHARHSLIATVGVINQRVSSYFQHFTHILSCPRHCCRVHGRRRNCCALLRRARHLSDGCAASFDVPDTLQDGGP